MAQSRPPGQVEKATLNGWVPRGAVSLWRYVGNARHFDGWHVTADEPGGQSLLALIDLLVQTKDVSLFRTVTIVSPTEAILRVPNNRGAPAMAPAKWRLRYSQAPADWSMVENGEALECSLGEAWMAELRASVEAMLLGEGDFAIGPARKRSPACDRLWFWWWPKPRA